jgi:hypothetical protein
LKVYIGFDPREAVTAEIAIKSLRAVTGDEVEPELLCMPKLVDQGLLSQRVIDQRGGQDYDLVSNAPQSTRFAISRFLIPIICQQGYALFVDSDVVFLRDPRAMLFDVFAHHAVSVVKLGEITGSAPYKMVNQRQEPYPRKLWSSVMLFNCDHPANRRLSLRDVNERPGRDLHRFYWLHDDEIGTLNPVWNWLVGVQLMPSNTGIAHMTLGGPWLDGWHGGPFDYEWKQIRDSK